VLKASGALACRPIERLRAKLRSKTVGRLAVQATYLLGGSELTETEGWLTADATGGGRGHICAGTG
jgi:hypothetical protein